MRNLLCLFLCVFVLADHVGEPKESTLVDDWEGLCCGIFLFQLSRLRDVYEEGKKHATIQGIQLLVL